MVSVYTSLRPKARVWLQLLRFKHFKVEINEGKFKIHHYQGYQYVLWALLN